MIFNANKQVNNAVLWLKYKFSSIGINKAVLGISGGKDSYVTAALLSRALGKQNVIGVSIPNGTQSDIDDAKRTLKLLDIVALEINIGEAYTSLHNQIPSISVNSAKNIPPRLRMTTLYAVASTHNALVSGTSNASEIFVGYGTKYGDLACDVSPLASFVKGEVVALGEALGLEHSLLHKAPSDGLGSGTDEEALGFTYTSLDSFIRTGTTNHELVKIDNNIYQYQPTKQPNNPVLIERFNHLNAINAHKRAMPPFFTFSE